MMMFMVVVVSVMFAAFRRRGQLAVQIGGCQLFHRCVRKSGANFYALLREQVQGAPPDAARDDDAGALFTQPARKKSRRVRWRDHRPDADNFSLFGVGLHECKFFAAAKVSMKPAFG